MFYTKKIVTIFVLISAYSIATAQEIPYERQQFHDQIDVNQKVILDLDGNKKDKAFYPSNIADINKQANKSATISIDHIQKTIEKNNILSSHDKMKYLRGLNECLRNFIFLYRQKEIKGAEITPLIEAFKDAMLADWKGENIVDVLRNKNFEVLSILSKNFAFEKNINTEDIESLLIDKAVEKNVAFGLNTLNKGFQRYRNKDSLLAVIARMDQDAIYSWARSNTPLASFILNEAKDPLVKTIGDIARTKQGRQYFPFLDNLYRGKITIDEIDNTISNPHAYYSLLVKTNIEYSARILNKENVFGRDVIENKIKEVGEATYINVINGLHEKPSDVRYKIIRHLTPQELYYLIVLNEEVIYTSSYVNKGEGLYNQIFKTKMDGTTLLQSVYADHFKKWIKMAANYNTLDDFLKRMEPENVNILMKAFVRNLDEGRGKDSLQDAVDVASSYSSINNGAIKKLVLSEVQMNRNIAKKNRNIKAFRIYDILNTLFLSMEDPTIDLTKTLGIEPVYFMHLNRLADNKGRIAIQQFFYGDLDGKTFYPRFVSEFSGKGWKFKDNKYWSEISSTTGTPITIYTNKPLGEKEGDGLDQEAQTALENYLVENRIEPTIVIHRGHSYHLGSTIDQLAPSSKIVLLGSCGGFQSLNHVLEKAPNTQIISTKQTGTGALNTELIKTIVQTLRKGKDLDWINIWKNLSVRNKGNEQFSDYVPPYQNLGAVFIMAYTTMEEKAAQQ